MAVAGLGLGLIGAVLVTRLMASQLYEIGTTDPATYGAMAAVLLAVALLAGFIPARRAARTDPATALRGGS
jgi:ABC-type antimicrobial peptide transport system permease subunit